MTFHCKLLIALYGEFSAWQVYCMILIAAMACGWKYWCSLPVVVAGGTADLVLGAASNRDTRGNKLTFNAD